MTEVNETNVINEINEINDINDSGSLYQVKNIPFKFPDGMKMCPSCRWVKPYKDFSKNHLSKYDINSHCKTCCNIRSNKYYKKAEQQFCEVCNKFIYCRKALIHFGSKKHNKNWLGTYNLFEV